MENHDIFFVVALICVGFSSNFLYSAIRSYIQNKPPGSQTIYDIIFCDCSRLAQIFISTVYSIAVSTRFDIVRSFFDEYPAAAAIVCLFNATVFANYCIHLGCTSIVRLACMLNLSWVEENCAEKCCR